MFSKVTEGILYVGVHDCDVDLFEGQYPVPEGISYNSYVIMDDKIVVMDTVDRTKTTEWMKNMEEALGGRRPDYLVVQHMEPDHSASIGAFAARYPGAVLIGNRKTQDMLGNFFPEIDDRRILTVESGETLCTGSRALTFIFAPMVHWPEVMMTYEASDKILFSADGFGSFGRTDIEGDWEKEARRYYIGIVGKYGKQVQMLLKKTRDLDIDIICSLHGPVLKGNLERYISLYDTWSSYEPETEGVCICYTSVYGQTKKAVMLLKDALLCRGVPVVEDYDLARCDISQAVASAFRYDKLVLAATTYNGALFPPMQTFLYHLMGRNFQKRTVAFIENGSWAPQAVRCMKDVMANARDITYAENQVTILSMVKDETVVALYRMAEELAHRYGEETRDTAVWTYAAAYLDQLQAGGKTEYET